MDIYKDNFNVNQYSKQLTASTSASANLTTLVKLSFNSSTFSLGLCLGVHPESASVNRIQY